MGPITTGVRTVMVGSPKWKYPQNSELDYRGELEICAFMEMAGCGGGDSYLTPLYLVHLAAGKARWILQSDLDYHRCNQQW